MWLRYGNVWYMSRMPRITVEPVRLPDAPVLWQACFDGAPVKAVGADFESAAVKRAVFDYFDARINIGNEWENEYRIAEQGGRCVYV